MTREPIGFMTPPALPATDDACIVCGKRAPDLICAECRALIRGESVVRTTAAPAPIAERAA